MAPIIQKGWKTVLEEQDARFLVPQRDDAESLAEQFNTEYERKKVWHGSDQSMSDTYMDWSTPAAVALGRPQQQHSTMGC